MDEKNSVTPMYFTSLKVKNINCLGESQLKLVDEKGAIARWTLILGDNGMGKTTLLKCLAWMRPDVEALPKKDGDSAGPKINSGPVKIKPEMDEVLANNSDWERIAMVGATVKSFVGSSLSFGVGLGEIPTDKEQTEHSISFEIENWELEKYDVNPGELLEFGSMNVFAYAANRHLGVNNLESEILLKDSASNLLTNSNELFDPEDLLYKLFSDSNAERVRTTEEGPATRFFMKVKEVLSDLLPDLDGTPEKITVNEYYKEGKRNDRLVEIAMPSGLVPFQALSLGYQTMFAWIADLAFRMLLRNRDSDSPLNEPAVVLVDEIDLHLHPSWQRSLKKKLVHHFKNTQFICTAHSPFMAQASESENLVVLRREDGVVIIDSEPYVIKGGRIGLFATGELFGLGSDRSPEIEGLIQERREILDQDTKTDEDRLRLDELDRLLVEIPVAENEEDQRFLDQIQAATEQLKARGLMK